MQLNYKMFLDNIVEGFVVQDHDGKIIEFNKAALAILGMNEDQLHGRKSTDPRWRAVKEDGETAFPGEQHPAMVTLKTGIPQKNVIMGINHPNNEFRWLNINSSPILDEAGKLVYVLATFEDITEQRNLRKEYEKSLFKLGVAVQAGKFGVWDWDMRLNRLEWDDSMYDLFGMKREDFTDSYEAFEKSMFPEDASRIGVELQKVFELKQDFSSQFRIYKNGQIRIIKAMSKNFYDENGVIQRLIGMNWDITDEVEREVKILQTSKMTALGEVSANIAHEINNPLAVISGKAHIALSLLKKETFDIEALKNHLSKIQETAKLLAKIVSGLKGFARDSSGDDFEPSAVAKIVEDAISLCQFRFATSNISLQVDTINPEWQIKCRGTQLMQVIMNLVNNSFDAIQELDEKWVSVHCEKNGQEVLLSVTDSGNGIPVSIREKLMQPFFTTKGQGKGTGLGLSLSKDIVEVHGGKLEYDASSEHTTFVISLPLI